MFPLTTLVVLEALLKESACLRERVEEMNEETKAKLAEIKANQLAAAEAQAATSEAVDNIVDDIASLNAKIALLNEKLTESEMDPEEQALLDDVVAGSAALNTSGTALKEKTETAAAIVTEAPEVPTEAPEVPTK